MLPYAPFFKPPLKRTTCDLNIVFIMKVLYELIDREVFIVESSEFVFLVIEVFCRTSSYIILVVFTSYGKD
jgi:hypothetical protein